MHLTGIREGGCHLNTSEDFKLHSYGGATYSGPGRNSVTVKSNSLALGSRATRFQGRVGRRLIHCS